MPYSTILLILHAVTGLIRTGMLYCISKLKQHLSDVWHNLQQNVIDAAINKWKSDLNYPCMPMNNILNTYCEIFIRLKNHGQINCN